MPKSEWKLELGAQLTGPKTIQFNVWAPHAKKIEVVLQKVPPPLGPPKGGGTFCLQKDARGYHSGVLKGYGAGTLYLYRLDGAKERPDPVSRLQPQGLHGPSCVVDPQAFSWSDANWKGLPQTDLIFYELHIGTFTPEGTFEAAIEKIPYLKQLGITCVEIMPVAQFPGKRNWGYDGASLYAVQNSYGGPEGFKKLVDACHAQGLAVCLDVVYNHFGPEGNYLRDFGPYFTPKYHTPWGDAVNYDDIASGEVRRFIIDNALYWITEYHIDVLRLDAVHAIFDFSAIPILEELHTAVQRQAQDLGRQVQIIAESDLNDPRMITPVTAGGFGLEVQWSDDFHHAVHAFFTKEKQGYYQDFGKLEDIAKALRDGFVYEGQASAFRQRRHGRPLKNVPKSKLVICTQNHDQIGNRALGDRLSMHLSLQDQKITAILFLLAPNLPLLFMGQEYGETAPFQYFIDHEDAALAASVREGRKREFFDCGWKDVPDPAAEQTFQNSKLKWDLIHKNPHKELLQFYRDLIEMRKKHKLAGAVCEVEYDEARQWLRWTYPDLKIEISFSDKRAYNFVHDKGHPEIPKKRLS